jgi:hypothetical protein
VLPTRKTEDPEIEAITTDQGRTLAYTRSIAHRREDARLEDPITSIPGSYTKAPLLRTADERPIAAP